MAQPEVVVPAPSARPRWAALAGLRGLPGGVVARLPAKVRTKLLVAFLAIAGLLVVVSLLGLRVLDQANAPRRAARHAAAPRRGVPGRSRRTRATCSRRSACVSAGAARPDAVHGRPERCRRAASCGCSPTNGQPTRSRRSSSRPNEKLFTFRPAAGRPAALRRIHAGLLDDRAGARAHPAARRESGPRGPRAAVRWTRATSRQRRSTPRAGALAFKARARDASAGEGQSRASTCPRATSSSA